MLIRRGDLNGYPGGEGVLVAPSRSAAQPLIIILGGDYFDVDGDPGAPSNRKYSTRGTPLVDYLNLSA